MPNASVPSAPVQARHVNTGTALPRQPARPIGGGIAGVASKRRTGRHQGLQGPKPYNEWEFVYDITKDTPAPARGASRHSGHQANAATAPADNAPASAPSTTICHRSRCTLPASCLRRGYAASTAGKKLNALSPCFDDARPLQRTVLLRQRESRRVLHDHQLRRLRLQRFQARPDTRAPSDKADR